MARETLNQGWPAKAPKDSANAVDQKDEKNQYADG